METLEKNTQVNFKTNQAVWQKAKSVFAKHNLDATAGFNLFLKYVADNERLPFAPEDEQEREALIAGLQARAKDNLQAIEQGDFITLDEMEKRLLG